ncbi:hypothetical protein ACN4EK_10560 [Pantanalinema rosaneae CENA516]|uniref:hypothetical protein n=1 Tax=Pantanalinema rosaneae TaxID=1620701 RepID=UPI003D6FE36D
MASSPVYTKFKSTGDDYTARTETRLKVCDRQRMENNDWLKAYELLIKRKANRADIEMQLCRTLGAQRRAAAIRLADILPSEHWFKQAHALAHRLTIAQLKQMPATMTKKARDEDYIAAALAYAHYEALRSSEVPFSKIDITWIDGVAYREFVEL